MTVIADAIRIEALYGDRLVPCYAERPRNLDDMLRRSVRQRGAASAIEDGTRRIGYDTLDRLANCVASAFAARGIARGDRVVLFLGNRWEFIVALAGLWRLGAIAVPIGTRQSGAELAYMVQQCGAAAIVYETGLAERLPAPDQLTSIRCAVCVGAAEATAPLPLAPLDFDALVASGDEADWPAEFDDQQPACIMYTSGTTGHPKGAVLSHLGFFHTARHYQRRFDYQPDDRMLLVIPASHISGLLAVVVVMLQVGGSIVCLRQFQAAEALDEIAARRVTAAVMVPAMYNLCLLDPQLAARDLTCWRIGHFGGAAMPEVSIQRLAQALPGLSLFNGFGATETPRP